MTEKNEPNFYQAMFDLPVSLSRTERIILEEMVNFDTSLEFVMEWIGTKSRARARIFVSRLRDKLVTSPFTIRTNKGGNSHTAVYRLELV